MTVVISPERPDTPDATTLINELEHHLASLYPAESRHGFSVQKLIDQKVTFVVLRADGKAAGCGGVMFVGNDYAELKRMYVRPEFRGARFGELIVEYLTTHAQKSGITRLRLETGVHQVAAIRLYERCGFKRIPPFGTYRSDLNSLCFEKKLERSPRLDDL